METKPKIKQVRFHKYKSDNIVRFGISDARDVIHNPNVCEREIQGALYTKLVNGIFSPNSHVFCWEADFLHIDNKMFVHEYEIKRNDQDFYNDFEKQFKVIFTDGTSEDIPKHDILTDTRIKGKPNTFSFVIPLDTYLICKDKIPVYSGVIIYYCEYGRLMLHQIQKRKSLHQNTIAQKHLIQISKSLGHRLCSRNLFNTREQDPRFIDTYIQEFEGTTEDNQLGAKENTNE